MTVNINAKTTFLQLFACYSISLARVDGNSDCIIWL